MVINIIGGLIIGSVNHDLSLSSVFESYILLTVGDGLVAQIPSLLLAIATATIVTRISSDEMIWRQISNQMGLSKAWVQFLRIILLWSCSWYAKHFILWRTYIRDNCMVHIKGFKRNE